MSIKTGIEIERRWLVAGDGWHSFVAEKILIIQGYIAKSNGNTVRIRRQRCGKRVRHWLGVKGARTSATTVSTSFGGASSTSSSCTCSSIRASKPSSRSRRCTFTMAILIMSACVPWIGMLTAARSAKPRRLLLRARMSGR